MNRIPRFAYTVLMLVCFGAVARGESFSLSVPGNGGGCADGSAVMVRGKGVGLSKEEALKDAYRDAVEHAVGVFVDAEQMMKNDEVVRDQILTQSNAYIEKCEIVREEKKDGGLVEIVVRAGVKRSAITKRIAEVMPPQTYDFGSGELSAHANMVSAMKRDTDAATLVGKLLDGFDPISQLFKVRLASPVPSRLPVPGRPDLVRLAFLMKVELDQSKYETDVFPRFKQILDQITLTAPDVIRMRDISSKVLSNSRTILRDYDDFAKRYTKTYSPRPSHRDGLYLCMGLDGVYSGFRIYSGNVNGRMSAFVRDCRADLWSAYDEDIVERQFAVVVKELGVEEIAQDSLRVLLLADANSIGCKGYLYTVDRSVGMLINEWQRKLREKSTEYNIVFKDFNGVEIGGVPWLFVRDRDYTTPKNSACARFGNTGFLRDGIGQPGGEKAQMWIMSHLVRGWATSYLEWRDCEFSTDDVAKIASVSIELAR